MDNKILTIVLVLIIGVLAGLQIVNNQSKNPSLDVLLEQQAQILDNQKSADLAQRLGKFEARLSDIEKKIENLAKAPQPQRPARPQEDFNKVYDIPVAHSPVRGPEDAPITIVEFVDFECPFCARFHPPVAKVLEAYPKKVNYMLKNLPLSFHPNAKPASKAAFAAGEQGKYFEMVDVLLQNGRNLNPATYEKLAKDLGLNVKKFKKDLEQNDAKYEAQIQEDMNLAEKVAVRGTPTFFLGGKKTNARDFARFKAQIDKMLTEIEK